MKMTLRVEMASGEVVDIDVHPVTQVAFERQFKVALGAIGDDPRLEYTYWMAWHASTRGRKGAPTFEQWLDTIVGLVGGEEEDADADPLGVTVSSGTSLPSPSSPVPG